VAALVSACPDPAPVSLLEAAGTADPELTLGPGGLPRTVNGFTEPTVQAQVDQYQLADGCATDVTTRSQGKLTSSTWTGWRSEHRVWW
jgi:poly(3-hydroxybutyrate) depolymerase